MAPQAMLPTLRVPTDAIASRVLVVGDPARAEAAAGLLDQCERIGANREFVTFSGRSQGRAISVCSHGVGSAGAGICFEELARGGAQLIVRAGTCGAIQDAIDDGELVIASGAVRDDGLTARLVPDGYPALAHHEIVSTMVDAAIADGLEPRVGIVLSTDLFYPSTALGIDWRPWKSSRVLAIEMELAALFVVASLHDIRAGGILAVDGNPTRGATDMSDYNPYRPVVEDAVSRMLKIAIRALTQAPLDR